MQRNKFVVYFCLLVLSQPAALYSVAVAVQETEAGAAAERIVQEESSDAASKAQEDQEAIAPITLNEKATGFRGIWYMNQPSNDEYRYKYSGGMGTYCAKHRPFAIYSPEVQKTFFCYGGSKPDNDRALVHMVSCFDHKTGMLARPTILLDKRTGDAHDNPVISMDEAGYVWIFSTSHGRARPSYVHRSTKPFDIETFERVPATYVTDQGETVPLDNFSYMQIWQRPGSGFHAFFTRYDYPAARTICYMSSQDGVTWSRWQRLAAMEAGHYQVSFVGRQKMGTAFNMHPADKGLNWRSNLYYVESSDGQTWTSVEQTPLEMPLTERDTPALVRDFIAEERLVYLKDLKYDQEDHPILLYLVSQSYQSGPQDPARQWMLSRWTGEQWEHSLVTESDNNYDMGELWLEAEDRWWILAPTDVGPQAFNPGGEVVAWFSADQGRTWQRQRKMTAASERNHTYVRNVLHAAPEFVAVWADGHGRQPSESRLYFSNAAGDVFQMPVDMGEESWKAALQIQANQ